MIQDIAKTLNIHHSEVIKNNEVKEMLYTKLKSVFQEYNKEIFDFSGDDIVTEIVDAKYKIRVQEVIGDLQDDFDENVSSEDFTTFVKNIIDL